MKTTPNANYKKNMMNKHKVRVFWHKKQKPGKIIVFSNRKYEVQPDGSLRKIANG